MPVADYAATTNVESTLGDAFTAEITDLRVSETLNHYSGPYHVSPATGYPSPFTSRPPSTIIPIGKESDLFFLGIDLGFVGTELGKPGMPICADCTVRFFLEGYGTDESIGAGGSPRFEMNIQKQVFEHLNADPHIGPVRHQLWVPVAKMLFPEIIEAPTGVAWNDLFLPDTIYRVAAHVTINIPDCCWKPVSADLSGYIEGMVMSTKSAD